MTTQNTIDETLDELFDVYRDHFYNKYDGEILRKTIKCSVKALIDNACNDVEKAYGGCRNCYGKGYATV